MLSAPIEPAFPDSSFAVASPSEVVARNRRFGHLRGVRWRIDLGILPSSSSSSIDDIRRVAADSRRRYATLRRRLLIDPHIPKDGSTSPDLVMDNPLSQNPDSMWGRFFRNAELEKMVDQDLSRLYPEHGSYFQTSGCQEILRRILLLWCLRHPEYGYRQGMHELLAPLLYVLHVDIGYLSEVRKLHEGQFADQFDGFSFYENDLTYKFDFKKFSGSRDDEIDAHINSVKINSLSELDPNVQDIVLLSDAYGAEGELGIVLSEKFMEHDAYCMFDALMSGAGGVVSMAAFFSPSPIGSPQTGLPPVIEASSALYHLLSIVDSSLYCHLVELGVEPQYFALRWLRVLFGREFALEDLLMIWDEILAFDNSELTTSSENAKDSAFGILNSSRGAFILALAVSMILYLRSSLLATETATSCLQRLLNFPDDVNIDKLITKAKSLLPRAVDANNSKAMHLLNEVSNRSKKATVRGHSVSFDFSPGSPLQLLPESYWEEKWRVLHKEEERKQASLEKKVQSKIKGWSDKVKLRLSRTESELLRRNDPRLSVRRSLLEDLSRQLGLEEDKYETMEIDYLNQKIQSEMDEQDDHGENSGCTSEEKYLSGNAGSDENSTIFSDPPSPVHEYETSHHENFSSRSSVASNVSTDENEIEQNNTELYSTNPEALPLPVSYAPEDRSSNGRQNEDSTGKSAANLKERKSLSGKFQWFWRFGRNGQGTSVASKAYDVGCNLNHTVADGRNGSMSSKGDDVDQNTVVTLRNIGQSMLENIQVIESVFQQERDQVGSVENVSTSALVGRGQVTAIAALKELRKISNLLSEM